MNAVEVKPKRKLKKILLTVLAVVVALVVLAGVGIYAVWHNEIGSVASIEMLRERNDDHLDGAVYSMHVRGGFYLDDFVAQGGVSNDTDLIQFITDNITHGVVDLNMTAPEIGCSSFTATAENGDALFARNYDFSKTNAMLVFTDANEGRHASISTVDLQFLGIDVDQDMTGLMDKVICLAAPYAPLDGVNDAGVSCGIYMTYQGGEETVATSQDTDKPDFTSTTLLRLILDYADNVEEAVEIASSYDLHDSANTSYHYMVADASGKSAILEWTNDSAVDTTDNDGSQRTLKVVYNDQDADIGEREGASSYQIVTNFVLQPGYYEGVPAENKKGADRYDRLYEELQATDGVVADEQAAMDILQSVGRRSWDNDDKNSCTVHSAVYNLTKKSVLWVTNENYDDPTAVFEFTLGE
ncbi:MAG TPA: linear amide C-N hydrolase [Candidatus Gemmiger excrementigallinarum]|uniref:Linear amide C-N hydrolase n=1 Tax=Candidatus Gemmiger excrementigallinarum TaxID=2838609 RepID=A0A9D2EQV1_9FIRM|nr:linear amide C-N hydrolase [Candidatus Gemmiger excrementigallinarum]